MSEYFLWVGEGEWEWVEVGGYFLWVVLGRWRYILGGCWSVDNFYGLVGVGGSIFWAGGFRWG